MSNISDIKIARVRKSGDNRDWNLRDMCQYIVDSIDDGDTDLRDATKAIMIYETKPDDEGGSHIWHTAMNASFTDRLQLIEWHKKFLFDEWMV